MDNCRLDIDIDTIMVIFDSIAQMRFDAINVAREKLDDFFLQGANAQTLQTGNSERSGTCSPVLIIYI